MKKKKQKPTKVHMMLRDAPWSLCGRYVGQYPGMQQTFDALKVTCQRCAQNFSQTGEMPKTKG